MTFWTLAAATLPGQGPSPRRQIDDGSALALILSSYGPRPRPYWPPPPPPGWEPGWNTSAEYQRRLDVARTTGHVDGRIQQWRDYDRHLHVCWDRRMRLVEDAAKKRRGDG